MGVVTYSLFTLLESVIVPFQLVGEESHNDLATTTMHENLYLKFFFVAGIWGAMAPCKTATE